MMRPPAGTNSVRWHTITVTPPASQPKIHFYNKLNPVWWFGNIDDPTPPAWYRPDDKHRVGKWRLRNPFHNFDHYVIGVADKKFVRSGRYPAEEFKPERRLGFRSGQTQTGLASVYVLSARRI